MIRGITEMLTIFGENEFKPLIRYRTEIPGQLIAEDGRIFSVQTQKFRSPFKSWTYSATGEKTIRCLSVTCNIPAGYFPDYTFRKKNESDNHERINIAVHRAVMETWRPIDDYPPIPKEDWDMCPESAKQWIRDTAFVDHIDDDPTNNHVDNLRWVVPKENQAHRKKHDQNSQN